MGHYTISACTGNDESSENLGFNILFNAPVYATYVKVSSPPPQSIILLFYFVGQCVVFCLFRLHRENEYTWHHS